MNKRAAGHLADQLDNRWTYTDSKTNATTTPQLAGDTVSSKEVRHLDFFHWAILNKNTLSFTMTGVIRDASVAGTALAQWAMLVGGSQVAQVNPSDIHLVATPGKGFFFTTDTVQPSVTSNVNAGGWTDQSQG
jgi:hypothetical protein